jgi:hypothetical protein
MDNIDKEKMEVLRNQALTSDLEIDDVEWLIGIIEKQENEIERYRSELSDMISYLETSETDSEREYADKLRALLDNE